MSDNEMNEIKQAILELKGELKRFNEKQDVMIQDLKSIKDAVYHPEEGLYARLRDLESWQETVSKVLWSGGLAVLGLITKALLDGLTL